MPPDKLAGERAISGCAGAPRVVLEYRLPKAWRFAQSDRSGNNSLVDAFAEMLPDLVHHLFAKVCSGVEHRHDDAADIDLIIRA